MDAMSTRRRAGPPRYGEHYDPEIREREIALIERVRELCQEGWGWMVVAKVLNKEGNRNRAGRPFTPQALHSVLAKRRSPRRKKP